MTKHKISHIEKVLNVWAIVLIIWSFYRVKFGTGLPVWFDEFIAKPVIFLSPVLYFVKRVEKKNLFESLGYIKKNLVKESVYGLLVSVILFIVLFFIFYLKGFLQNLNFLNSITTMSVLYFLIISFATSFSEETLSRGFVLTRLHVRFQNIYLASFFGSILYFFIHIPILFTNKLLAGNTLIGITSIEFILGFILSLVFLLRKNIIIPIFIHTFYNLALWLLM